MQNMLTMMDVTPTAMDRIKVDEAAQADALNPMRNRIQALAMQQQLDENSLTNQLASIWSQGVNQGQPATGVQQAPPQNIPQQPVGQNALMGTPGQAAPSAAPQQAPSADALPDIEKRLKSLVDEGKATPEAAYRYYNAVKSQVDAAEAAKAKEWRESQMPYIEIAKTTGDDKIFQAIVKAGANSGIGPVQKLAQSFLDANVHISGVMETTSIPVMSDALREHLNKLAAGNELLLDTIKGIPNGAKAEIVSKGDKIEKIKEAKEEKEPANLDTRKVNLLTKKAEGTITPGELAELGVISKVQSDQDARLDSRAAKSAARVTIRQESAEKRRDAKSNQDLSPKEQKAVDTIVGGIEDGRIAPSQINTIIQRMGGGAGAARIRMAIGTTALEKGLDLAGAELNFKARGSSTAIQRVQLAKTVVPIADEVIKLAKKIPPGIGFVPADEMTRKLGRYLNNEELIQLEFDKNKMVEEFERMLTGSQMADTRVQRNLDLIRTGYDPKAIAFLASETKKIANMSTKAVKSDMYDVKPGGNKDTGKNRPSLSDIFK